MRNVPKMNLLDSSRSSTEKTVSPLLFSDSSSLSRSSQSPKTPLPLPRSYLRRVDRARMVDEDGAEEHKRQHNTLSLLFLLAVVSLFMMWSLDICCMSFAKRMIGRPPTRTIRRPASSTAPSPTNGVEVHLDGVATEAKNSVAEFFDRAGNFKCPQPQRYTREQVAVHHTPDDLWIVIDGNVLDVSLFIDQHPGGRVMMNGAGGQDMATVFARSHDPSSVGLFSSFCIGRLAGL